MSGAIDWSLLESQYFSNQIYNEILDMVLQSPPIGVNQISRLLSSDLKMTFRSILFFKFRIVPLMLVNSLLRTTPVV